LVEKGKHNRRKSILPHNKTMSPLKTQRATMSHLPACIYPHSHLADYWSSRGAKILCIYKLEVE